jgi:hypothetical protein
MEAREQSAENVGAASPHTVAAPEEPMLAPQVEQALRLQQAIGNRALSRMVAGGSTAAPAGRRVLARDARFPDSVVGAPQRLNERQTLEKVRSLLGTGVLDWGVSDEEASEAVLHLGRLNATDHAAFERVVKTLDSEGLINTLLDEVPFHRVASMTMVEILAVRPPEKNAGLAKKFLTEGWFDWVTDREAEASAALIEALPPADREAMYKSWFGDQLRSNRKGSPDYERGIGEQLLTGAVIGDFEEDPTGWEMVGQIATGFVPYAGQVADIRDLAANWKKLHESGYKDGWAWFAVVLTLIGFVPGIGDIIKGAGKAGLKWMRKAGKKMLITFGERVAKKVLEPVLEHVIKPAINKLKQGVGEWLERWGREAAKKESGAGADVLKKGAREAMEQQADASLKGAVKGGAKAGTVVESIVHGIVEQLQRWAKTTFGQGDFLKIWPGIEGDDLVIYGQGSTVRIIRVRIKEIKRIAVELTEEIIEKIEKRADKLEEARKHAGKAIENMLRKEAIDVTEEVGEHIGIKLCQKAFGVGEPLYRGSGANVLDLVFKKADGTYLVCEAKGGMSRLGRRDVGPGVEAMQGTMTYLVATLQKMAKSSNPKDVEIAEALLAAHKNKGVQYVITQTGKLDDVGSSINATLKTIVQ